MHSQLPQVCQAELAAQPQKWPLELDHPHTAAGAPASRRQGAAGLHQPPAAPVPQLADHRCIGQTGWGRRLECTRRVRGIPHDPG